MLKRFWLTGSVALMFLLGTLVLAAPAQAYVQNCDSYQQPSQAYAECMVRAEDREAAPIGSPAEQSEGSTTTIVETTSTEVWQLALAGVLGAVLAGGAALGVSRLGHREGVTAH